MAKGNMLLGQARGSVGDVVFSVQNGEQISKIRVRNPRNPQTDKQQIQRAIMATVAQAWALLSPVIRFAWISNTKGQYNQNEFTSLNVKALRNAYADDEKEPRGYRFYNCHCVFPESPDTVLNKYQISSGNLANGQFMRDAENVKASFKLPAPHYGDTVKKYATRIKLGKTDRFLFVFMFTDGAELYTDPENPGNEYATVRRYSVGYLHLKPKDGFKTDTSELSNYGQLFDIIEQDGCEANLASLTIRNAINVSTISAWFKDYTGAMGVIKYRGKAKKRSNAFMYLDRNPHGTIATPGACGLTIPFILQAWDSKKLVGPGDPIDPQPEPAPVVPISIATISPNDLPYTAHSQGSKLYQVTFSRLFSMEELIDLKIMVDGQRCEMAYSPISNRWIFEGSNARGNVKQNQDITSVQIMVEFFGTFDTCTLNSITI